MDPVNRHHIPLNEGIFVLTGILKFVVASTAEVELGALFMNFKEGKVVQLILHKLGHPQPPTPIHCDNQTAVGIANETIKKQRSRSMEMRFFWVTDQVQRSFFNVRWHPGQENLANYFTKHFDAKHHQEVRPWYLHKYNSPRFLPNRDIKICSGLGRRSRAWSLVYELQRRKSCSTYSSQVGPPTTTNPNTL